MDQSRQISVYLTEIAKPEYEQHRATLGRAAEAACQAHGRAQPPGADALARVEPHVGA